MTELEHRLLEAARADRVPEALSARMAQGLQLGGATLASTAPVAKLGVPLFAKKGLWGALSVGLVAAAGWYAADGAPAERPAASAPPQVVAAPPALEPPVEAAPPTAEAALPELAETGEAAESLRSQPAPLDDDALGAEVALLAQVRQALQQRATARALRLLDQHRRRFAGGTLAPEAAALRIEALMQEGSYAEARAQAARFARAHPSHPLRARVTDLVEASASAPLPESSRASK